jgi:hypothetical protein
MRLGRLTEDQVAWAAYVGDAASRALVSTAPVDFDDWLEGLLGREDPGQFQARVAIAAAHACLPLWDPHLRSVIPDEIPDPPSPPTIWFFGGMFSRPPRWEVVRCRGNPIRGLRFAEESLVTGRDDDNAYLAVEADALEGSVGGEGRWLYGQVADAAAGAIWAVLRQKGASRIAVRRALLCLGRERLRRALELELVPWILGDADPVRARLDAWALT